MEYSKGYVFRFAAAVCLVCAILVCGAAVSLKDRQDENKLLDRYANVLDVAGLSTPGESLSREEIKTRFDKGIEARIVNLKSGEYVTDIDATTFDQRRASKDPATSSQAPSNKAKVLRLPHNALVYLVKNENDIDKIILPIVGKGLWSTLYGFLALNKDGNTIEGITYYEHGETPGLGGEVDNPKWKALWKGRKASDEKGEPKIEVIKGKALPVQESPYCVDGLSGATITSRSVTHMLRFWLGDNGFGPYLKKIRKIPSAKLIPPIAPKQTIEKTEGEDLDHG